MICPYVRDRLCSGSKVQRQGSWGCMQGGCHSNYTKPANVETSK